MTQAMGDWPATIPFAARAAAERWPDRAGLIAGEDSWTFAQLWADARAAASAMAASSVGRGDRVAIWAPNSREWILAALGAQCLGAAVVPLNTRFKSIEAGDILRRARVRLLFTPARFLGQDYAAMIAGEDLPELVETVHIDLGWDAFVTRGRGPGDPAVDQALAALEPDEVCDIIFTSGTTGKPKGALTTHAQATQTFGDWGTRCDLRAGDRYLIVNPFFHTFGYKAGWVACLIAGATIVPMATFDVQEMIRKIEVERISFLPGPPTIYQTLLREAAGERRPDLSSLRVAVTGAAPVPPSLVRQMRDELGMANIVNGYGMTECGVISMTLQGDDDETVSRTSGLPLPGIEVRCVDEEGRDLPAGAVGELWVRGYAVTGGYLDDPAATAEAIDPGGWLHTGDLGTVDERGYIAVTDRKKDVYISGGFNVYPAEVENLLVRHPSVAAVAVIGVPDEHMGEVGKAYIVPAEGAQVSAAEITEWSRRNMANYKVPRVVTFVDDLPRNASGKVLKGELRD